MRTGFDITDLEVSRNIQLKILLRSSFLSKRYVKSSIIAVTRYSYMTVLFRATTNIINATSISYLLTLLVYQ